jgi:hypothetical protein
LRDEECGKRIQTHRNAILSTQTSHFALRSVPLGNKQWLEKEYVVRRLKVIYRHVCLDGNIKMAAISIAGILSQAAVLRQYSAWHRVRCQGS